MGDIAKVVAAAVHAKLSMLELNRLMSDIQMRIFKIQF